MTSDRAGENIVVGRHAVAEALARSPETARELMLDQAVKPQALARILDLARLAGVKVRKVSREVLDQAAGRASHQGVALLLAAAAYSSLEDLLDKVSEAGRDALVVIADHLQDPQNLGALIRSAAAAGAQGVVIAKDRACPLTPAVAKAAAGGMTRLDVVRVTNLTEALKRLKEAGLWALAAATRGAPAPWELDLRIPLVLGRGGEQKGVGARLEKECDLTTTLPLANGVESLNVSVAAGVLLFEMVRQRG